MLRGVISRAVRYYSNSSSSRMLDSSQNTKRLEKSMNQVLLLGRVGCDPQKKGTADNPVIIFSVATQSNFKQDNGETLQKTDWHRICVFKRNLRDSAYEYTKKGQRVMVTGKLSHTTFKDEDGDAKYGTSIIAEDIVFFQ